MGIGLGGEARGRAHAERPSRQHLSAGAMQAVRLVDRGLAEEKFWLPALFFLRRRRDVRLVSPPLLVVVGVVVTLGSQAPPLLVLPPLLSPEFAVGFARGGQIARGELPSNLQHIGMLVLTEGGVDVKIV